MRRSRFSSILIRVRKGDVLADETNVKSPTHARVHIESVRLGNHRRVALLNRQAPNCNRYRCRVRVVYCYEALLALHTLVDDLLMNNRAHGIDPVTESVDQSDKYCSDARCRTLVSYQSKIHATSSKMQ